MMNCTWLEELVSKSNTIQTQEDISVREDCKPRPKKTMYISVMVSLQHLRIPTIVWARVLLGARYYQVASVDCSGVIQKIHMRKNE